MRFTTLGEYLKSKTLTVNGVLDDGFGTPFPVIGHEIEASILFADISSFTARTADLSAAETLVFVQNFFAWIRAEAIERGFGIIDKYVGDAVMVVFSEEFGSADPFAEAIRAATDMSRRDVHAYQPHMGIASGKVIVARVGEPTESHVTVIGAPVTLAARCAGVLGSDDQVVSSTVVFPEAEWLGREFDDVVPVEASPRFELANPRVVEMKGIGRTQIREIQNTGLWIPMQNAEDRAREGLQHLRSSGSYRPKER